MLPRLEWLMEHERILLELREFIVCSECPQTMLQATGLGFFNEQFKGKVAGAYVFHMGKTARKFGKIWSLPWQEGLREIGL